MPVADIVPWRDRPEPSADERAQLERYIALFNARDWTGVRELLAEECRLDLVSKSARQGKPRVGMYYDQYAKGPARLTLGRAEGRPVIGVYRGEPRGAPDYIITLEWSGGDVALIRDYRYVPYLMDQLEYEGDTA